jgi:hypothetical protein
VRRKQQSLVSTESYGIPSCCIASKMVGTEMARQGDEEWRQETMRKYRQRENELQVFPPERLQLSILE